MELSPAGLFFEVLNIYANANEMNYKRYEDTAADVQENLPLLKNDEVGLREAKNFFADSIEEFEREARVWKGLFSRFPFCSLCTAYFLHLFWLCYIVDWDFSVCAFYATLFFGVVTSFVIGITQENAKCMMVSKVGMFLLCTSSLVIYFITMWFWIRNKAEPRYLAICHFTDSLNLGIAHGTIFNYNDYGLFYFHCSLNPFQICAGIVIFFVLRNIYKTYRMLSVLKNASHSFETKLRALREEEDVVVETEPPSEVDN